MPATAGSAVSSFGMQLQAQCVHHLKDSVEVGTALARERLIEVFQFIMAILLIQLFTLKQ